MADRTRRVLVATFDLQAENVALRKRYPRGLATRESRVRFFRASHCSERRRVYARTRGRTHDGECVSRAVSARLFDTRGARIRSAFSLRCTMPFASFACQMCPWLTVDTRRKVMSSWRKMRNI